MMRRTVARIAGPLMLVGAVAGMSAVAVAQSTSFPDGARIGFVNVLQIARESAEGQAAAEKIQTLGQQRIDELNERNAALNEQLETLEASTAPADDPARTQLVTQIRQNQLELRRAQLDAQMEVANLERQLLDDFSRRLGPIIEAIAEERDLHVVLPVRSGFLWANPGLDLTDEVMERFNAGQP